MVESGVLEENEKDTQKPASSKEPLSFAELQIRYNEAVDNARRARTNLLGQIEQNQLDSRTKLDWDPYWKFRSWVKDLDLEAHSVQEELEKAEADLKELGKREIASDIRMLRYKCSEIDHYRFLMNLQQKET